MSKQADTYDIHCPYCGEWWTTTDETHAYVGIADCERTADDREGDCGETFTIVATDSGYFTMEGAGK